MAFPQFSRSPSSESGAGAHDADSGGQRRRRTDPEMPAHPTEAPTAHADALIFVRGYRPESSELLEADSAEAAASQLLALRLLPSGDQDPKGHAVRKAAYAKAAKKQGVPGFTASLRVSTLLFLAVAAGVLIALIAAWNALGRPDRPLFAPERFAFVTAVEILLLAPTALVPVYLVFHASVHWRARTHGRAVLRVALKDGAARRKGIPLRSPFHGIWSSWAVLAKCLEYVLYGYAAVAFIAWWSGRDSTSSSAALVVILYAVPVALILLLVVFRAKIWQRRDELLDAQLYRDIDDARSREGLVLDHPVDEEFEDEDLSQQHIAAAADGYPVRGAAAPEHTEWRSDFSAGASAADHLVDPDRREG